MGFVVLEGKDGGLQKYEAPPGAVAYIKPSGARTPEGEFISDQSWGMNEAALVGVDASRVVRVIPA